MPLEPWILRSCALREAKRYTKQAKVLPSWRHKWCHTKQARVWPRRRPQQSRKLYERSVDETYIYVYTRWNFREQLSQSTIMSNLGCFPPATSSSKSLHTSQSIRIPILQTNKNRHRHMCIYVYVYWTTKSKLNHVKSRLLPTSHIFQPVAMQCSASRIRPNHRISLFGFLGVFVDN